jgi:hypothetical protein
MCIACECSIHAYMNACMYAELTISSMQVLTLQYWSRYLDKKKEADIMRNVVSRKVYALTDQARGVAMYEFPIM